VVGPAGMAGWARGRMRSKREALGKALRGRMSEHHRMLIALHLEHIDLLDEQIERLSAEIATRLRPHEATLVRLETIPGVGRHIAEILAAEMGLEMDRFPSAGHLASWAGMCPGNYERAGRRKKGTARKGNKALRRALNEAAQAAARTKKPGRTYLRGQYRRLVVRCGKKKAAVAVGHTILRIAYHLLKEEETYHEGVLVQLDARRRARVQQHRRRQAAGLRCDDAPLPPQVRGRIVRCLERVRRAGESGFGERVRPQIVQPEPIGDDGAVARVEKQHDRAHPPHNEVAGCLLIDGEGVATTTRTLVGSSARQCSNWRSETAMVTGSTAVPGSVLPPALPVPGAVTVPGLSLRAPAVAMAAGTWPAANAVSEVDSLGRIGCHACGAWRDRRRDAAPGRRRSDGPVRGAARRRGRPRRSE